MTRKITENERCQMLADYLPPELGGKGMSGPEISAKYRVSKNYIHNLAEKSGYGPRNKRREARAWVRTRLAAPPRGEAAE